MSDPPASGAMISSHPRGTLLAVIVAPRSSRNQIESTDEGVLRMRVTAPPIDGAANAAVVRLLAEAIDVPRSRLEIVSGARGRRKHILVIGLTPEELSGRLAAKFVG